MRLHKNAKDITGQIFSRLTVLRKAPRRYGRVVFWACQCSCGTMVTANGSKLRLGELKSCGCLKKEGNNRRHGGSGSKIYAAWAAMRRRCDPKNTKIFPHYAGLKMLPAWKSYRIFQKWARKKWKKGLTLDRRDNLKGYSPTNCRWRTPLQQVLNRRTTVWVVYKGKRMCMAHAADLAGVSRALATQRRAVMKWPRKDWFIPAKQRRKTP